MRIVKEREEFFLEENGRRIGLFPSEVKLFRLMKPMGRKNMLRRRAIEKLKRDIDDAEARLILEVFQLPACEWDFMIPD